MRVVEKAAAAWERTGAAHDEETKADGVVRRREVAERREMVRGAARAMLRRESIVIVYLWRKLGIKGFMLLFV